MMSDAVWAELGFGEVALGDARRTTRLVRIAASAARSPGGTVSSVFSDDAERQGAYDFLESEHVDADALETGVCEILAQRCALESRIYVAVDGSSLTFEDNTGERGLGAVGTYAAGAVGLKVISALAMTSSGVPLGLLRQVYWRRPVERPTNRRPARERPLDKKETKHWVDAVTTATSRVDAASNATRITFLIDREGDSAAVLGALVGTGHDFVVRGNGSRTVESEDGRTWEMRRLMAYQRMLGDYELELVGRPGRSARVATMSVTAAPVLVALDDPRTGKKAKVTLWAVHAREMTAHPKSEDPVDWLLLTSGRVETFDEARAVIASYTLRWRIEEFHRAWKSGHCDVEESQLRSVQALKKWAFILATVAVRIERLKRLARAELPIPATHELSKFEHQALLVLQRRHKKKNETVPSNPTIQQAVLWIAQLGGYTGKSSGGPPGAVTIARGLQLVRAVAQGIQAAVEGEIG